MVPTLGWPLLVVLGSEDPRPYTGPTEAVPDVPTPVVRAPEPTPAAPAEPRAPRVLDNRENQDDDEPEPAKKKKQDKARDRFADKVKVHGRLMTGYQWDTDRPPPDAQGTPQPEDSDGRFFLRQARVRITARVGEILRLNLGADLGDAIEPPPGGQVPYLRNAYADIRIVDALRIRAGNFKRPFSRLELEGVTALPFRGRGLGNRLIVEDRRWGTRALGAMVWGEAWNERFKWYASASTPDLQGGGVDAHGRIEVEALRWLGVGGGGGYKLAADPLGGDKLHLAAATGDVVVRIEGLQVMAEAVAAQNANFAHHPFSVSVVGWAAYAVAVGRGFSLQPTVVAEWVDADTVYKESEAARIIGGVNVLWRDWLRVLPQVELVRPLGTTSFRNPWVEGETYYLMLAVEI